MKSDGSFLGLSSNGNVSCDLSSVVEECLQQQKNNFKAIFKNSMKFKIYSRRSPVSPTYILLVT